MHFPEAARGVDESNFILTRRQRPRSLIHAAKAECGDSAPILPKALSAALRDIAHELGLGQLTRSGLAFAGLR